MANVVVIPAAEWPPTDARPDTLYLRERTWVDRAACRGADPSLFVPEEASPIVPEVVRDVCPSCPVRQQCFDYGVEVGASGWWGGRRLRDGQPGVLANQDGTRRTMTTDDVAQILDRWRQGDVTQRQLAAEFSISRQRITQLLARAR